MKKWLNNFMKIAIISDSHDNLPNIDKAMAYIKNENITLLIHCGDICAGAVLTYLAERFEGKFYWLMGNVHAEPEKMIAISETRNLFYLKDPSVIEEGGLKIGLTHYPDEAKKLAQENQLDFVFYGHTHQPWEETVNGCKVVNPGTLAGMFSKATFAVLDTATKKLELKLLEIL